MKRRSFLSSLLGLGATVGVAGVTQKVAAAGKEVELAFRKPVEAVPVSPDNEYIETCIWVSCSQSFSDW